MNNPEEMEKFLEIQPDKTPKEREKENISAKKCSGPDCFTGKV